MLYWTHAMKMTFCASLFCLDLVSVLLHICLCGNLHNKKVTL